MQQDSSYQEIEELKRELFILSQDQQSYQELIQQFDSLKNKYEQLCSEKQQEEQRTEQEQLFLQKRISTLENQIQEQEEQQYNLNNNILSLRISIEDSSQLKKILQEQIKDMSSTLEMLKQENYNQDLYLQKLEQDSSNSNQEYQESEAFLKNQERKINQLNQEISKTAQNETLIQNKNFRIDEENQKLKNLIETKQQEHLKVQQNLNEIQQVIKQQEGLLTHMEQKLAEEACFQQEHSQKIFELNNQIKTLNAEIAQLSEENDSLMSEIEDLQTKIKNIYETIEQQKKLIFEGVKQFDEDRVRTQQLKVKLKQQISIGKENVVKLNNNKFASESIVSILKQQKASEVYQEPESTSFD